jgi:hypothetical protein
VGVYFVICLPYSFLWWFSYMILVPLSRASFLVQLVWRILVCSVIVITIASSGGTIKGAAGYNFTVYQFNICF